MHNILGKTTHNSSKNKSACCSVPVFMVAIALKEKGQPFSHDPLNSLLSVQALQRSSRRQIPQVKLQYRPLFIFKTK